MQARRQREILRAGLEQLAPGGRLVYSTCSMEPEENEQVVEAALGRAKGLRVIPAEMILRELAAAGVLTAEAAEMDLSFHRTIWEASGNPHLVKTLESLVTVLFAYKTLETVSYELRQWRLNHHRALLNVLLSPKEPDIPGALLMHLRMAYKDPERFSSMATATGTSAPSRPAPVKTRNSDGLLDEKTSESGGKLTTADGAPLG